MLLQGMLALLEALPGVVMWMLAAAGWGFIALRPLAGAAPASHSLQGALGVAIMLSLDSALGSLGWLHGIGGWILLVGGWLLFIAQIVHATIRARRDTNARTMTVPALAWAALPAAVVLLLASASAPGWLWASEFGGYDALSYHLQLPREWLALGRIAPLQHNVYSFLPSFMEAGYLHLMIVRGDPFHAAINAQLLHAAITLMTALVTGRACAAWLERSSVDAHVTRMAGCAAGVIVLGTPWTIVVGSLAYNEMTTCLMLAAGLRALASPKLDRWRIAILLGIFSGAAIGAKLTAALFVAAPLGVLLLIGVGIPCAILPCIVFGGTAAATLLPYLLRNGLHAGNPVFPFAHAWLGQAHWHEEQFDAWQRGHAAHGSISERFTRLWQQFFAYGIGARPAGLEGEPWMPQWSLLPWLGIASDLVASLRPQLRRPAVLMAVIILMQLVLWLFFTHMQSRFLLPMVVPLAICVGLAVARALESLRNQEAPRQRISAATLVLALLLTLWCAAPVWIFAREQGSRPARFLGTIDQFSGAAFNADDRAFLGQEISPYLWLEDHLVLRDRVLLMGDGRPFYLSAPFDYHTVWDRGPISRLVHDHPYDPQAWFVGLRAIGYTHLLIDPSMLERWRRSGWLDENIDPQALVNAARKHAHLIHEYPGGGMLFAL